MDPTFNDENENENDNSSINDDDNDNSVLPPEVHATAIPSDSDSDSDPDTPGPTSVTVAAPSVTTPVITPSVTVALPDPRRSKPPIEDSRRLFQRLWTDADEIELLQGFLDYTSSRGGLHHHHDTSAFYDVIRSKLQLEFNKNQLVEKLRRLKKKYRTVLAKIDSGKDFAFKSPHDQITFEISSKIWCNLKSGSRGGGGGGGGDFDDDDASPNPNSSGSGAIVAVTPPSGGYYVGHINLNNSAGGSGSVTPVFEQKPNLGTNFGTIVPRVSSPLKLSTRKRERVKVERMDDRFVRVNLGQTGGVVSGGGGGGNDGGEGANVSSNFINSGNANNINRNSNVHVGPGIQGMIEETMRNCLSPVFKELISTVVNANASANANVNSSGGRGGACSGGGGGKGVGALAYNAMPLNFSGVDFESGGDFMNEKWRNQQILELEVYSKRLELIQDQIKLTLEELRLMGS